MITSAGEERTLSLHGKNEIIPLSWLLGSTESSLSYYDTLSDTRLISFNKDDFLRLLSDRPVLYKALLDNLASDHTSLLLRVAGLEQPRAIDKIGFTLYYLMFRYGIEKAPGTFVIDLKLSQGMLASLVGLTRESTAKNLMTFRQKSIIDYKGSVYTVYKKRLENFLGEDAFRDLEL
jgi:CRP/FNR family transcriptional regulator